jgi:hypothetical protein
MLWRNVPARRQSGSGAGDRINEVVPVASVIEVIVSYLPISLLIAKHPPPCTHIVSYPAVSIASMSSD